MLDVSVHSANVKLCYVVAAAQVPNKHRPAYILPYVIVRVAANGITDDGATLLLDVLQSNYTLARLYIYGQSSA